MPALPRRTTLRAHPARVRRRVPRRDRALRERSRAPRARHGPRQARTPRIARCAGRRLDAGGLRRHGSARLRPPRVAPGVGVVRGLAGQGGPRCARVAEPVLSIGGTRVRLPPARAVAWALASPPTVSTSAVPCPHRGRRSRPWAAIAVQFQQRWIGGGVVADGVETDTGRRSHDEPPSPCTLRRYLARRTRMAATKASRSPRWFSSTSRTTARSTSP